MTDALWGAQGTTPEAVEQALRELLIQRHDESDGYVPARALNMVGFVESRYSGEIANRLRGVGRYHASRLIVLSYEPGREHLDARATVASDSDPAPGELSPLRRVSRSCRRRARSAPRSQRWSRQSLRYLCA